MLVDAQPGRPDHVYLSDFGLTKAALSSASLTGTGHVLGTLNYCAPEQIQGGRVDARTDEYALACAVYALLTGEPPFPRDEGMAVLYAHLSTPPPPLTSRRPGLSSAVDDVLLRALAKAPEGRYASCGEFADALRGALGLQRYDSDVAIALHERSLVDQQHRLGLDHADTLATHASSVAACQEAGRSDEAIALHQQTLLDQQQTLGRDHPEAARGSIPRRRASSGGAGGAAADAGRITRTRWPPGSPSPRRWRRAATTPERRSRSRRCWRRGSGRWAGITRTRWRPGSLSPGRWRRAATMPRRTRGSGMCSRRGSGR